MVSREVKELLRRGIEFFEESKSALEHGRYAVACFLSSQALEIILKAKLIELTGYYLYTHSHRRLLEELSKKSSKYLEILKAFSKELRIVESEYLTSRYLISKTYDKSDAEYCLLICEKIINMILRDCDKVNYENVLNKLKEFCNELTKLISPITIILFGSYAKRKAVQSSDIDLLIITEKNKIEVIDIIDKIKTEKFKDKNIEYIVLNLHEINKTVLRRNLNNYITITDSLNVFKQE